MVGVANPVITTMLKIESVNNFLFNTCAKQVLNTNLRLSNRFYNRIVKVHESESIKV